MPQGATLTTECERSASDRSLEISVTVFKKVKKVSGDLPHAGSMRFMLKALLSGQHLTHGEVGYASEMM